MTEYSSHLYKPVVISHPIQWSLHTEFCSKRFYPFQRFEIVYDGQTDTDRADDTTEYIKANNQRHFGRVTYVIPLMKVNLKASFRILIYQECQRFFSPHNLSNNVDVKGHFFTLNVKSLNAVAIVNTMFCFSDFQLFGDIKNYNINSRISNTRPQEIFEYVKSCQGFICLL